MPFSASMKFRRKVCANLWMTVEKRRAQRLRVQGSKREKGLFHTARREHGGDREDRSRKSKVEREKSAAAAKEAGGGSVKRIIEEVDADAGHAIVTEGLDVRHAANEFAFEGRERFHFLGNFQAKLKLDSFAEFEARRKIGAALGDIHGLRRN